jgi:hypothetical protein
MGVASPPDLWSVAGQESRETVAPSRPRRQHAVSVVTLLGRRWEGHPELVEEVYGDSVRLGDGRARDPQDVLIDHLKSLRTDARVDI